VEAAIVVPAAMMLIFLVVQACLWAYASSLVSAAADRGVQAASVDGGSLSGGVDEARAELSQSTGHEVVDPSVRAALLPGDLVEVSVSGTAESLIPGLHLQVSAVRSEPKQEFRDSG
jgi:TadE-like protein